jgi:hypothetical protein
MDLTTSTHMGFHAMVVNGHIHNQGTQKDGLTKKDYKGLQKTILNFYYIYYFMIIVDWYMTISRMMPC